MGPLFAAKDTGAPSVFRPENLLREARRQKRVPEGPVPDICLLDPDGDLLSALASAGRTRPSPVWACYHTTLHEFDHAGVRYGVIGCAVGAAFAVLLAEQLFASGCRLLLSLTSAGQIETAGDPPYFIVIDRSLRDEGTSYHYLPPADFAPAPAALAGLAFGALRRAGMAVRQGATWTTDAPFRETEAAIAQARAAGVLAVEMEAAALYAFAAARGCDVLCLAHVTNRMAQEEGDFEKGEANGAAEALAVIAAITAAWKDIERKEDKKRAGPEAPRPRSF